MTLSEELAWRGFANQTTFESIEDINAPRTFYLGVDPSSDSMQIGNLAAVMLVRHLVNAGHKAIVLVGGAPACPAPVTVPHDFSNHINGIPRSLPRADRSHHPS